ncbi:MAG: hypothetical protein ACNA8W_17995 [Bradymonadaceae bacterium]
MKSERKTALLHEVLGLSVRFEAELDRDTIFTVLSEVALEYHREESGPLIDCVR